MGHPGIPVTEAAPEASLLALVKPIFYYKHISSHICEFYDSPIDNLVLAILNLLPLGWVCILICVHGSWLGVRLLLCSLLAANFLTGEPEGDTSDGGEDTPRDATSVALKERLGLYWTTPGEWSNVTPLLPWTDGGTCTFKRTETVSRLWFCCLRSSRFFC